MQSRSAFDKVNNDIGRLSVKYRWSRMRWNHRGIFPAWRPLLCRRALRKTHSCSALGGHRLRGAVYQRPGRL